MAENEIPESLHHFIFESIDSVEQLEVLLLLRLNADERWDSTRISNELRSSAKSVLSRLIKLEQMGLLESDLQSMYHYKPKTKELDNTVAELAKFYKERPHKVFELIFSPLKKARHFADAFMVKPNKKKDDQDG